MATEFSIMAPKSPVSIIYATRGRQSRLLGRIFMWPICEAGMLFHMMRVLLTPAAGEATPSGEVFCAVTVKYRHLKYITYF